MCKSSSEVTHYIRHEQPTVSKFLSNMGLPKGHGCSFMQCLKHSFKTISRTLFLTLSFVNWPSFKSSCLKACSLCKILSYFQICLEDTLDNGEWKASHENDQHKT